MAGLRGRTFGGYQLVEQLLGGGIADVYRGRPIKAGGRDVVIKVIYPEFAHQPGFLPRFRQIVANSGKLASHPHILPLIASGEDSGYLYLVTPFVEAGTLRDWLRKGGRMGAGDVAPFFRQLCDALTYAHSLGVVHGNLKPSNIFLFEGRHVLVGDFGILWDVSHIDMNHAGSGTEVVEFLAPEMLSGQVTQLSDIYSIGAVLFAALTGRAPFQAATPAEVFAAAAHHPVPHLVQANPALAPQAQALDSVIQRAMAKRPEDRFPSAAAVAQIIETSIRQAPGPVVGPALPAGLGTPFIPASPPMPFGSMPLPPELQGSAAAFPAPGMLPHGGAFPAGGAPFGAAGGGFPAPAISLAQAAAAMGSSGVGAGPSLLAQLDPPFPPLPSAARPEPQMEQARMGGLGSTGLQPAVRPPAGNAPSNELPFSESTVHAPAPAPAPSALDVPLQPTMRVPAPGMPANANAGPLLGMGPAGQVGPGALPAFDAPLEQRAVRISGAPRAKLGRPGPAPFPTLDDDDEEFAPQSMPAVRPPAGQSGFAVAGGGGSFDPGARGMSAPPGAGFAREAVPGSAALDQAGHAGYAGHPGESGVLDGPAAFGSSGMLGGAGAEYAGAGESGGQGWGADPRMGGAGGHAGYTGEHFGYSGQYESGQEGVGARWGEYGADYTGEHGAQYTGEYAGARSEWEYGGHSGGHHQADMGSDDRPFSATKLELPRLTSPALVGQPPSWQEIISDTGGVPASMTPNTYGAGNARGERAPTWEDAGESMWHIAVPSGPREQPRVPQHVEAEWAGTGIPGGWEAQEEAGGKSKKKKRGKRGHPEEPEDSGFDDDRVWTVGMTAVRGRRRWPRKVALLMVIIILIDLAALVVLRPDLCPNASCRTLSTTLRQHLGLSQSATAPASFSADPSSVTLSVANGKSAVTTLTINNATKGNVTWKAATTLPWISTNPGSGSLAANSGAAVVLTAKPTNIKPGPYTTKITITFTGATTQSITIPVTLNVTG